MLPVPGERDMAKLGEIMKGVASPPRTTCVVSVWFVNQQE